MKKRRDHTPLVAPAAVRPSLGAALGLMRDRQAWESAQSEFDNAMLAPGGAERLDSLLKICTAIVAERHALPLLPLDADKLHTLGSALRGVKYKSGAEYLRAARAEH